MIIKIIQQPTVLHLTNIALQYSATSYEKMALCMHAHHACVHTHPLPHSYLYALFYTHTHTHTHAHIHEQTLTCTLSCTRVHAPTQKHSYLTLLLFVHTHQHRPRMLTITYNRSSDFTNEAIFTDVHVVINIFQYGQPLVGEAPICPFLIVSTKFGVNMIKTFKSS